jgi:SAM-dependent methyltransferase
VSRSPDPETAEDTSHRRFLDLVGEARPRSVCEFGTRQALEGRATHSRALFPFVERSDYVMVDVQPGADVDVVADLHCLPDSWTGKFDAVIASAVFEHLARPWVAAGEIARIMAPQALCYVGTHQSFPLHGHPDDYYRFSDKALALLFADAGLDILCCTHFWRCWIVPPVQVLDTAGVEAWNATFPSYIGVSLVARKT